MKHGFCPKQKEKSCACPVLRSRVLPDIVCGGHTQRVNATYNSQRKTSSRGVKLRVPVDRGAEKRLGSLQVLTGDSGYLNYREWTCGCSVRLTDIAKSRNRSYVRRIVWKKGTGNLNCV
ncbi:hypothetical protein EVAR_76196_1 [Eumeta japonica]|uniref:Uncharacterized protein n=1 Tax=Eumeta variegata TaxID=151549 RepID=A0A4C1UVY2_EUMVA|nr:hypothetical protein EVAR_76196_1 [Eumeta japonica]